RVEGALDREGLAESDGTSIQLLLRVAVRIGGDYRNGLFGTTGAVDSAHEMISPVVFEDRDLVGAVDRADLVRVLVVAVQLEADAGAGYRTDAAQGIKLGGLLLAATVPLEPAVVRIVVRCLEGLRVEGVRIGGLGQPIDAVVVALPGVAALVGLLALADA